MSGARVLTFGKHIANFKHFLNLVNSPTSVLYKNDVIKLDRQDDRAAYRSFCYHNLAQCLNKNEIKKGYESFFIYLFVLGELVDSYLNREICPVERIRMCMTAYFFLRLWRYHIETMTRNYSNFMFIQQNFMAIQILLVKSHREYYPEFPLLPWMHGSEACEHVFGIARQIRTDFDFAELLQMISKISHYSKSIRTSNLLDEKEKSVREGYIVDYNKGNLNNNIISNLTTWPSDLEITRTIRQSRQLACELAEYLNMLMSDSLPIGNLQPIILIETNNKPEVSSFLYNKNKENNDIESNNIENEINENCNIDLSQAITQASNEISNIQIIDELNFENNEDINKYRGQRKNHDAYNSRPILRKLQTSNLRTLDDENSVLPNMASHIVSYFVNNNNCEQNFVSQRENRWKFCHQSMAKSLADYNNEKSQQTYYGKRNTISLRNLNNNIISNLTTWPSDLEITRTIRQSRQLACELAEYLNMLMSDSLPIGNLQPIILIETNNKPEVSSFLYNKNKENNDIESNNIENEINENCNIDLSQAITQASNEISNIQIIDELNFENNEDINKYRGQSYFKKQ
ncbi:hypothetical protein Glove_393g21 [Diversispora epigaea]|uniref:Uncharacterized protein n=1 Tax=Diversispora epigaea TaxID=1348612 RepID=A0A397H1X9_9GLOM|nr:hypothetical protein Glove_393g21 [Diversispora epigaea]